MHSHTSCLSGVSRSFARLLALPGSITLRQSGLITVGRIALLAGVAGGLVSAQAASFSYEFTAATDYSANFSAPAGGTSISHDSAKRYLIFNAAEAANLVATIKLTASGQTSFQNEPVSLDVIPISYPSPNPNHLQYQWANGSVGLLARVQGNDLGVLGVATLIDESHVRLRLFYGASITNPNTVGTAFWDATFDLAAGTMSGSSGGQVAVNKFNTLFTPRYDPSYYQLSPFTVQLTQNGGTNPTFQLSLTNARGLMASTANVALTATTAYNGAGAAGVRFFSGATPGKFAVDNFWGQGGATISVSRSVAPEVSQTEFGVSYAKENLDPSYSGTAADPTATNNGKIILRDSTELQNQHMMGFGVGNPHPGPGDFQWSTLDARFSLMDDLELGWSFGGTNYAGNTDTRRIVTLCLCPDWLKGGPIGSTKWTDDPADLTDDDWLERAPIPESSTPGSKYPNFTNLAEQLALTFPSAEYYQVWNEMKGLWNGTNDWDWPRYMDLYNETYAALRSVPGYGGSLQIGGPYLPIQGNASETSATPLTTRDSSGFENWLQNKTGADFICADFSLTRNQTYVTEASVLARTWLYEAIVDQVRALPHQPSVPLPFWWSEYYGWAANKNLNFQRAVMSSILLHQIAGGTAVSLLWGPQNNTAEQLRQGLFTSNRTSGGGLPQPLYAAYQKIHDNFGKGALLFAATSDTAGVHALANGTSTIVVNKRPVPVSVTVEGTSFTLAAYDVQLIAAAEQIIDNLDPARVTITGSWTTSNLVAGYYNQDYLSDGNSGKGTKSVRFTPNIGQTGSYHVYTRWPVASNRATNVPIDIIHAGGTTTVTLNEANTAYANQWVQLTTSPVTFNAGSSGSVLFRTTGTNNFVMVDAVRFVRQ